MELPSNYLEEMKELLGDQYEAYLASFEQKTRQGLRVNTAKIAPETFRQKADISLECVPWCENGFAFDEKQTVTKHPYYYAGLYYVQEPSAMIPASHLPVEPGDFVLDLCAAPGGKATELGAKLKGKGMLLANDISNSRAKGLLKNLELFGISNLFVSSEESDKLKKAYPAYFDKILIDAPCSGEGMFRRDKAMVKDWLQKGPDYYVPIQRKLLLDAADMLKKGGMLLYSTCTFSVKENEENIAYLLQERPDMELLMPEWDEYFSHGKKEGFENCIRIFPHLAPGEGHFAALLGKRTDGEWITKVNEVKTRLQRGKEIAEQINILGDDGVPVEYHVIFWKSELIDFVILQQDAFDEIDAVTPMERQEEILNMIIDVCHTEFEFDNFNEVMDYFKKMINICKQMNYSKFKSEEYDKFYKQLQELIAERKV